MATLTDPTLDALARALIDPTPRVLFGSPKKPGIFSSKNAKTKAASEKCLAEGWVVQTDGVDAKKNPLYRVTEKGSRYAIENSETVQLLREIRDNLRFLVLLRDRFDSIFVNLGEQEKLIQSLEGRVVAGMTNAQPSTAPANDSWHSHILEYVKQYPHSNPTKDCPLPELFERVAKPAGLSIGQFHDGIRRLAEQKKIRLFPYTRPSYTLENDHYALVAGQEIKYYVQLSDPA